MTRVRKGAFNVREKLSELEKPIGLKGSELMKSETVQDARDFVSAGRKNLVINGAMEIAQRATSGTKSGNSYGGYLCVDRWASYYDGTGMEQVERTINNKLKKALRITAGGSDGRPYVYHKIENSSKFLGDGTPFSISFWMRASGSTVQQLQWRYYDNGNQNNGSIQLIKNVDVTTEWQYYKIENLSIPDASHNRTRDGGLWNYNMNNEIGTGFWIEFTDVQIEFGKQCTEFEHRPIGEELALCQRYYQRINSTASNSRMAISGNGSPALSYPTTFLRTTMRIAPTIDYSAVGDFWNEGLQTGKDTVTAISLNIATTDTVTMSVTASGGNGTAQGTNLLGKNSNAYLAFDAEL